MKNVTYARKMNQFGTLGFSVPAYISKKLNLNDGMLFKISEKDGSIIFTPVVI